MNRGTHPECERIDLRRSPGDQDAVLAPFHECAARACDRARALRRPVLAWTAVRVAGTLDPVTVFDRAARHTRHRILWLRPADRCGLVGLGAAWTCVAEGADRFARVEAGWRSILDGAVGHGSGGPIALYGFAFAQESAVWDGYPAGLLIVPRLTLHWSDGEIRLILSTVAETHGIEGAHRDATALLAVCAAALGTGVPDAQDACAHRSGRQALRVTAQFPSEADWKQSVRDTATAVSSGRLQKAVLALGMTLRGERLDPAIALRELRAAYPACTIFAFDRGTRCFLGATPERLVRVHRGEIEVAALAGSAPRGRTGNHDRALCEGLLRSPKNRLEHALVVDALRGALADIAAFAPPGAGPHVLSLRNTHHLYTPLRAALRERRSVLALIARLHPTPAVGGMPRDTALAWIRRHEGWDRGWYAGPIGWMDWEGEGDAAVAIRSALVSETEATLFAGCGIVAESDPEQEFRETRWKLQPLLSALSVACAPARQAGNGGWSARVGRSLTMSVPTPENATYACVGALLDELVRGGVAHVCLCPGSRSTPLALCAARQPGLRVWSLIDERSAGFFALGMAKASGRPAALVTTSGTAAANLLPAVIEAHYSRVPLVVLTADRPRELRDVAAPQTIDQVRLYGGYVKWFVDVAPPEATDAMLRYFRTLASRAAGTAWERPAGPVHLNVPLREPLVPTVTAEIPPKDDRAILAWDGRSDDHPYARISQARRSPAPDLVGRLAESLAQTPHGVIVAGPQLDRELPAALAGLAAATGYPILADPLSQLRCGPHDRRLVIDAYDALLRIDELARGLAPEVVLRFGGMPASKALARYMALHEAARQIVVDGEDGWTDPTHLASDIVHADARSLCEAVAARVIARADFPVDPGWAARWTRLALVAREALSHGVAEVGDAFEGKVFAELCALLPDGATLYVGNSMPVRDLDTFFPGTPRSIRILGNRGASGIDGLVSSALGAAAVADGPVVLVLGDLSFYHDLNGLLAAKLHRLPATIVLLNNDGGGIFSFLPQAAYPEYFETLFGTPTGLDFHLAARLYGHAFARADTWPAFRDEVRHALHSPGVSIVEMRTRRDGNVALHKAMGRVVEAALRSEVSGASLRRESS